MQDLDTSVAVRTAVGKMPKGHRQMVWYRIYEGRTWDEIASEVGVSRPYLMKEWEKIAAFLRAELAEVAA